MEDLELFFKNYCNVWSNLADYQKSVEALIHSPDIFTFCESVVRSSTNSDTIYKAFIIWHRALLFRHSAMPLENMHSMLNFFHELVLRNYDKFYIYEQVLIIECTLWKCIFPHNIEQYTQQFIGIIEELTKSQPSVALAIGSKLCEIIFNFDFFKEMYFPSDRNVLDVFQKIVVPHIIKLILYLLKQSPGSSYIYIAISAIIGFLTESKDPSTIDENNILSFDTIYNIPIEWGDLMIDVFKGVTEYYVQIYHQDQTSAHEVMKCLINLHRMSGPYFNDSSKNNQYIEICFSCVDQLYKLPMYGSAESVGYFRLELSELFNRTSKLTNLGYILTTHPSFLTNLYQLTITIWDILKNSINDKSLYDTNYDYTTESYDFLSDSWNQILLKNDPLPHNVIELANELYKNINDLCVAVKCMSVDFCEDEDDFHELLLEQQMIILGSIGRLNPHLSMQYLYTIQQSLWDIYINQFTQLKQSNQTIDQSKFSQFWERYYFFFSQCGYFLSDTHEGETPLIPRNILLFIQSDPNFILFMNNIINQGMQLLLDNQISPSVASRIYWFLLRWMTTYLPIDINNYNDPLPDTITMSYSFSDSNSPAFTIIRDIFEVSKKGFSIWSTEFGEEQQNLLDYICNRCRQVCDWVISISPFQEMVELLFLSLVHQSNYEKVPDQSLACIFKNICIISVRNKNLFTQIINRFYGLFLKIIKGVDFVKKSHNLKIIDDIVLFLTLFAKVAVIEENNTMIADSFTPLFNIIIDLFSLYRDHDEIELLIFQIFDNYIIHQLPNLISSPQMLVSLYKSVSLLFNNYKESLQSPCVKKYVDDNFIYKVYKGLLLIGQNLLINSILDLQKDVADYIKSVMNEVIIFIITTLPGQLFGYTKICGPFYILLRDYYLWDSYSFVLLHNDIKNGLFRYIDISLNHPSIKLVRLGLEILYSIFSFHAREYINNNNNGPIVALESSSPDIFLKYTKLIFTNLLQESRYHKVVNEASNIFVTIIIINKNIFTQIRNDICINTNNQNINARFIEEYNSLFDDKITYTLDRNCRWKFQSKLNEAIPLLRSLIYN